MEPAATPIIQDINIISSENTKPQNNNFDSQQYFLEFDNNNEQEKIILKAPKCCRICCIIFFIFIMIGGSIPSIILFLITDNFLFIILPIGIIILFTIFIILILKKYPKKYIFSRNIQKNKFYIEQYNYLNNKLMELELTLGNYYIKGAKEDGKMVDENGNSFYYIYKIYIYNQFSDTSEINLDTTNIKQIPAKFTYAFEI